MVNKLGFQIHSASVSVVKKFFYHNLITTLESIILAITEVLSFQDYPKLSQNYYGLLECLANDHMSFISNLEPQVFLYILSTISEGLTALGKIYKIHCCDKSSNRKIDT